VDESPNIDCRDWGYGSTGLMFAAQNGHIEIVKYLVSQKANIFLKSERAQSKTALDFAISSSCESSEQIAAYLKEVASKIKAEKQAEKQEKQASAKRMKKLKNGIPYTLTTASGEKIFLILGESLEIKAFSVTHSKTVECVTHEPNI
jgi:ankyrin repeat protein